MDSPRHAIERWLQARTGHWQSLERKLQGQLDRPVESAEDLMVLVDGLRGIARDLSLAREVMPGNRIVAYLEQLYIRAHEVLHRPARSPGQDLKKIFTIDGPRIAREMRGTILATSALFLGCVLIGWLLVEVHPELAALFASAEMIDQTQQGTLWTEGLLNILPSSVLAVGIIANNLTVTFFAFALGTFFGLGTLYIISLNGLMLGGVFAFTGHYGLDGRLLDFILPHGVVELSVICLAGAAGVRLGEALMRPGSRTRVEAFQTAVSRAGTLLLVAAPFLVGAGLIEGYISPDPTYPRGGRLVIGLGYGLVFWLVVSGLAFRPPSSPGKNRKPTPGGVAAAADSG